MNVFTKLILLLLQAILPPVGLEMFFLRRGGKSHHLGPLVVFFKRIYKSCCGISLATKGVQHSPSAQARHSTNQPEQTSGGSGNCRSVMSGCKSCSWYVSKLKTDNKPSRQGFFLLAYSVGLLHLTQIKTVGDMSK